MDSENALCRRCQRKAAVMFCTCSSPETFLCKACIVKHSDQEPGKEHPTRPINQLRFYQIPGYFDRLQARIDSFPFVKQQALQGSLEVSRVVAEYKLQVESAIRNLTNTATSFLVQLNEMRDALTQEVQTALEEVEITLKEDRPQLTTRYGQMIRQCADSKKSLQLLSISIETYQLPAQDWVIVQGKKMQRLAEDLTAVFGLPAMLTNEAKLKIAQLPAFRYSQSATAGERREPMKLSNGNVYIGEWKSGKRCGPGKLLTSEGGLMEGYWANDFLHGKGREITPTGDMYEGDFFEGKKQGSGRYEDCPCANAYEGKWQNDLKHGKGTQRSEDGSVYDGLFKDDRRSGLGVVKWPSGEFCEGEFLNGLLHGRGRYVWTKNSKWYEGQWREGKMHGKGKLVNEGKEYEGDFVADKKQGKGVYRWEGHVYEGDFADNKMHGKGYLTMQGKAKQLYAFESNKRLQPLLSPKSKK